MPRLIAKEALRYASRDFEAGDEFDATDSDAFILTKVGKAVEADEAPRKRRYARRDMRAEN